MTWRCIPGLGTCHDQTRTCLRLARSGHNVRVFIRNDNPSKKPFKRSTNNNVRTPSWDFVLMSKPLEFAKSGSVDECNARWTQRPPMGVHCCQPRAFSAALCHWAVGAVASGDGPSIHGSFVAIMPFHFDQVSPFCRFHRAHPWRVIWVLLTSLDLHLRLFCG